MKYFVCLLFFAHQVFAQDFTEKTLETSIDGITVYLQGGLVARSGKVKLPSGKSVLKIEALSPHIDGQSVQVKANGDFTILSVSHQLNYLNRLRWNAKIDSLNNEIKRLERKIATQESRLEVLAEKQSLLNENKNLGGDSGATLAQIKQAVDFYDTELSSIKAEEIETKIEIEALREQLGNIEQQVASVRNGDQLPTGEIEVRVEAQQPVTGEFSITYLVANTGWYPKYDVRVTSVDQPLSLAYKASVYQNTGVDWSNVKLKFSNGSPNQSGVAPELQTWYLNYARNVIQGVYDEVEMLEEVVMEDALQGKVAGVRMRESNSAPREADVITATTVENQTTLEFEVDEPYSIPSDGKPLSVDLNRFEIETQYEYYAVPKLDKDAFLIARIIDWDQYNLLEGEANLYFEDAYVGRSVLNAQSLEDTLDISLGRDKSIVIGRTKVDKFSKRKFISSNQVASRGFEIIARNKKPQPIQLTLFDQIPVAAIGDITVEPTNLSGGKLNEQTGEVVWELSLKPQAQTTLDFSYEVKYPKDERVDLE